MATYIAHHGILGMKWGIRRYQNKDGSLTEEGKKRYGIGEDYDPNRPTPEQDLAKHNRRVETAKKVAIITGATAVAAYIVSPKVRATVKNALGKIGGRKIDEDAIKAANSKALHNYADIVAKETIKNGLDEKTTAAIAKASREELIKQLGDSARSTVRDTVNPKTKESFAKLVTKGVKEGSREGALNAPKNFAKVATFGLVTLGLKEVTDIVADKVSDKEQPKQKFSETLYKQR